MGDSTINKVKRECSGSCLWRLAGLNKRGPRYEALAVPLSSQLLSAHLTSDELCQDEMRCDAMRCDAMRCQRGAWEVSADVRSSQAGKTEENKWPKGKRHIAHNGICTSDIRQLTPVSLLVLRPSACARTISLLKTIKFMSMTKLQCGHALDFVIRFATFAKWTSSTCLKLQKANNFYLRAQNCLNCKCKLHRQEEARTKQQQQQQQQLQASRRSPVAAFPVCAKQEKVV